MATPPNPLAAMIIQSLAGQGGGMDMGGGGFPGGGPGPGMPPGPDTASQEQFSRELSSLRQADPAAMLQQLVQIKQQVGVIINQTLMSLPGVARASASILKGLDAAIKEAQQAAATASVAAPPINSSILPSGFATPGGGSMM